VYNFAPAVFPEIRGFIVNNWLYIYDSKYCPLLATTFSHLSGSIRIPRRKNWSSFEAIHESIQFFFLHKTRNAGQPGRVPLIETSNSQREQRLENTAGGVGLPISKISKYVLTTFATKSLYRVSRCIAAVCLSMLGSIRSPVIVSVSFNSYIIHYAELVPPNTEHDLGVVNIRFGRRRGSMAGNSP